MIFDKLLYYSSDVLLLDEADEFCIIFLFAYSMTYRRRYYIVPIVIGLITI